MKKISLLFFALALTGASLQMTTSAQGTAPAAKPTSRVIEDGGTGMYPAIMLSEASLPTHTIFRPQDLKMFDKKNKMPILVWGNGACGNSPWEHLNFLSEVASHGFFIVAIGPMPQEGQRGGAGQTQAAMLTDAMNWAIAQNADKNSPYFEKLDVAKMAAAGMSCGGLQALEVAGDPRLSTVIVCNSGIFITGTSSGMPGMPALSKDQLKKVHTPIMYLLGGSEDIAYNNGMDDFEKINHVPAFVANMNVGHGGTYMQPHGGEFAKLATAWLKWQLKGDKEAAKLFTGNPAGLSKNTNWVFEKKNID